MQKYTTLILAGIVVVLAAILTGTLIFMQNQPVQQRAIQPLVEIKAMDRLTTKEEAQILNYLKAFQIEVGVLINFGASPRLEWSRHVWSEEMHHPRRRAKASPSAP